MSEPGGAASTAQTQRVPHHPAVIPLLVVRDARRAIDFYRAVFGATESWRLMHYHRVGHAILQIGQTPIALLDEFPEADIVGPPAEPEEQRGVPRLTMEVDDVDALVERAVAHGATVLRPPGDQWWGVRSASLRDPFGYRWGIQQVIEEISPAEMQRRADELGLYPPPENPSASG